MWEAAQESQGRFSASEYSSELFEVFKIDTSSDAQHIHPPSFCLSCRVFMGSWHSRGGSTPAVGRVFTWEKHHEGDCKVSGITYLKYWAQTHNVRSVSTSIPSNVDGVILWK